MDFRFSILSIKVYDTNSFRVLPILWFSAMLFGQAIFYFLS